SDSTVKSVGVQLKIPLFQGGGASARVREAIALRDKAREEMEDTRREVQAQVRQTHAGIHSGLAQIRALELAEGSSEEALKASRVGLQVGSRNILDVFNAETQLQTVRRDLARARYEYLLNILRLKAAAGTLDENDLNLTTRNQ
ncbi:MAG: TolC family protein, partial [Pseudomonadota bacterium]